MQNWPSSEHEQDYHFLTASQLIPATNKNVIGKDMAYYNIEFKSDKYGFELRQLATHAQIIKS